MRPPIPPSAVTLARKLISTGTPLDGGRHVRVQGTCRTIAKELGRSPGTIHEKLRHLETAGVRVSCRPIVLDVERLDQLTAHSQPSAVVEPEQADKGGGVIGQAIAAIERLTLLAVEVGEEAQPAVDRAISAVLEVVEIVELNRAGESADRAVRTEQRAVSRTAREPRGPSLNEEVGSPKNSSTYLEQTKHSAGKTRAVVAHRTAAEAIALVKPLAELCTKYGLAGVTDSTGLRRALAGFTDDQAQAAVGRVIRRVRIESQQSTGERLRSPIGYLIRSALENDPAIFAIEPTAIVELRPTSTPQPSEQPTTPASATAVREALTGARSALRPAEH